MQQSFHELSGQHRRALIDYSLSIVACKEEAADVVQDVFLACLELARKGLLEDLSRPYLFRAVRNRSFNLLRSHLRFAGLISELTFHFKNLLYREQSHAPALELCIQGLPKKYQELLLLRLRYELPLAEIAEVCSIPIGTVKSRLHKALTLLKERAQGG